MLLIQKVKIIGFKSSSSVVTANLSGENTSIIYGENGCGKTTFLKVLYATLAQDEAILLENNVETVFIEYSNNGNYKIVKIKRTTDKNSYDWSEIVSSELGESSSISLGVDRGVTNRSTRVDPRLIFDFFRHPKRRNYLSPSYPLSQLVEELSIFLKNTHTRRYNNRNELSLDKQHLYLQNIQIENIEELLMERYRLARLTATRRIQSALFDTLSIAIDIENRSQILNNTIPDDFDESLSKNADRIIEALDDGEENQFKDKVVQIISNLDVDEDFKKIRENPILSQLFVNIIEELRYEKLILNSINLLIDTFNKYLINGKELVVTSNEAFIQVGIDSHSINELSSGERHILTFLSLVLFEGGDRDFVIIDEPEISLNIKWQREIVPLFSSLIPDTQIIVASHSPSLTKNINHLCKLELDYSGNL
ncbi:AAA family ATPase [Photobacterium carnosum]|uniref:AAA family ATPase n=1 Tax=Photobacterium carnosum TaxID=2023717 RepID=UPI001E4248C7|nr:AAA family ATPase [Photobacterium carnosum]MCD9530446.1 AAA family ATPase [Photobacterium carnosum]MCF2153122.1 AAA family ATPase [Photobacterium carnosum]MCF2214882.1 AAA family ATPase [Photobacterium carnosum]